MKEPRVKPPRDGIRDYHLLQHAPRLAILPNLYAVMPPIKC